jgi:hypothetical protein
MDSRERNVTFDSQTLFNFDFSTALPVDLPKVPQAKVLLQFFYSSLAAFFFCVAESSATNCYC